MDKRKQAILRHLGLYRVSLRAVIEDHVIGGDASRELNELRKEGLIKIHERILGGGRSVYQLSRLGAEHHGFLPSIARVPGPQGLLVNLSILWFCFCQNTRRFRLEDCDQDELLGSSDSSTGSPLARYHVLEPQEPQSIIYRIYVPTRRAKIAVIERRLYGLAHSARSRQNASALFQAGLYRIVVLVQNEQRAKKLRQFLHRPCRMESDPVTSIISVKVEVVPDFLLSNQRNPAGGEDV